MVEDEQYTNWEDAIDTDDFDLPSPLSLPILPSSNLSKHRSTLPPLKSCSQSLNPNPNPQPQTLINSSSRPRIPGPAGAVQSAMHRKSQNFIFNSQGEILDRRSDSVIEEEEVDEDFKSNPWLFAAAFLGRDFELTTPISFIKNRKSSADRIPQVVCVVKSCVPNGLGDLFVTLKDPTGMIGASIHRKVLMESNLGGKFSDGCAVILKQVAVFRPGYSSCYLNVTVSNMVKLISKDCAPPHKQMVSSTEAICSTFGKEMKDGWVELSSRQREESVTDNEARRELNNWRTTNFPYNTTARDITMPANSNLGENLSSTIVPKLHKGTVSRKNTTNKPDPRVNTTENVVVKSILRTDSKADASTNMAVESEKPKRTIFEVSAAQWTDEQLLELFADYQDDMLN